MFIGWWTCIPTVYRPLSLLSLCDSEFARKPPNAHSLGRQIAQKPPFSVFQIVGIKHKKHAQVLFHFC